MPNYSNWPLPKLMAITQLTLDPQNHRIPFTEGAEMKFRELLSMLVEREGVYELAKKLKLSGGVAPAEALVAVREKGNLVVVEGNRRLCALRLLLDPSLAPPSYKARIVKLASNIDKKMYRKAPVVIAPSREESEAFILMRHHGIPVKQWDVVQQGRFFTTLLKKQPDAAALAEEHNMDVSAVRDAIRIYDLYSIARIVDVEPKYREILEPDKFPSSTLERIFKSPDAAKVFPITFDQNGRLQVGGDPDEFKKHLSTILTDCARDKMDEEHIDTRTLGKADDIKNYLTRKFEKRTRDNKPVAVKLSVDEILAKNASPRPPLIPPPPPPKVPKPIPVLGLIHPNFVLEAKSQRIQAIVKELKSIILARHENAVAVLLRTLLDLCFQERLWDCPAWKAKLAATQTKNKKKPDWHPSLWQMVSAVENNEDIQRELNVPPGWIKALRGAMKSNEALFDRYDYYVHNNFTPPQKLTLQQDWQVLEPIISGLYPAVTVNSSAK